MTPIIFISFLVSLAWVEFRYTLIRLHSHSEIPKRMPRWLHHLIYHEAPYQYVQVDSGSPKDTRWYYHSKQRKLMKMEVEDAFQIRNTVLLALGLFTMASIWGLWRVGHWTWTIVFMKMNMISW